MLHKKMKAPFCTLIPQTIHISVHRLLDFLPLDFKYLYLYFVEVFWDIAVTGHPISE